MPWSTMRMFRCRLGHVVPHSMNTQQQSFTFQTPLHARHMRASPVACACCSQQPCKAFQVLGVRASGIECTPLKRFACPSRVIKGANFESTESVGAGLCLKVQNR
jgi:hypothetical protein